MVDPKIREAPTSPSAARRGVATRPSPTRAGSLFAIGGAGAGLVVLVCVASAAPATQGCYTHQCDSLTVTLGLGADGGVVGTGEMLSTGGSLVWESNPNVPPDGGTWLPFNGNQTYVFMLPYDAGIPPGATVANYQAYVSATSDPEGNSIVADGQLAEFSGLGTDAGFSVLNDTCANYFLRVTVTFAPPDAGGTSPGAGTDAGGDALPPPDGGSP